MRTQRPRMPRIRAARSRLLREIRSLKGRVRLKINRTRREIRWEWSRLRLETRNLLHHSDPIKVQVADIGFLLAPKGATAARLWGGMRLERAELQFLLDILQPGMTFFDVGAGAGLVTIIAARKMRDGRVYAFEPCSRTYQLLEENLGLNGIHNVAAVRAALADHNGQAVLQLNAAGKDELNTIGRATNPDAQVVSKEEVPVTTLDAFMEARGIARVDVMNVDVEGAELPVFRGARKLLERQDAPLIVYRGFGFNTKGFGYHPVETMWSLQNWGYSVFLLDSATGRVAPLRPGPEYDATVVAAKPTDPAYRRLQESLG